MAGSAIANHLVKTVAKVAIHAVCPSDAKGNDDPMVAVAGLGLILAAATMLQPGGKVTLEEAVTALRETWKELEDNANVSPDV